MNSTGGMTASTHASTSSWQSSSGIVSSDFLNKLWIKNQKQSKAATPTDYLNTGALALYANNVEDQQQQQHLLGPMSHNNNRKRTISNPRYMSLSERENSVSDS